MHRAMPGQHRLPWLGIELRLTYAAVLLDSQTNSALLMSAFGETEHVIADVVTLKARCWPVAVSQ